MLILHSRGHLAPCCIGLCWFILSEAVPNGGLASCSIPIRSVLADLTPFYTMDQVCILDPSVFEQVSRPYARPNRQRKDGSCTIGSRLPGTSNWQGDHASVPRRAGPGPTAQTAAALVGPSPSCSSRTLQRGIQTSCAALASNNPQQWKHSSLSCTNGSLAANRI